MLAAQALEVANQINCIGIRMISQILSQALVGPERRKCGRTHMVSRMVSQASHVPTYEITSDWHGFPNAIHSPGLGGRRSAELHPTRKVSRMLLIAQDSGVFSVHALYLIFVLSVNFWTPPSCMLSTISASSDMPGAFGRSVQTLFRAQPR